MSGGLMGHQDESKPETKSDKKMSKVHKAHRKEIDDMKDGPEKLERSIMYNRRHRDEHQDALVKAQHRLKRMGR